MSTQPRAYTSHATRETVAAIQYTEHAAPDGLVLSGEPISVNGVKTGRYAKEDSVLVMRPNGTIGFDPIRIGEWFVVHANGIMEIVPDDAFKQEYGTESPDVPVFERHFKEYRQQTQRLARIARESLERVMSPQPGDTFDVTTNHLMTALENMIGAINQHQSAHALGRLLHEQKKNQQ